MSMAQERRTLQTSGEYSEFHQPAASGRTEDSRLWKFKADESASGRGCCENFRVFSPDSVRHHPKRPDDVQACFQFIPPLCFPQDRDQPIIAASLHETILVIVTLFLGQFRPTP